MTMHLKNEPIGSRAAALRLFLFVGILMALVTTVAPTSAGPPAQTKLTARAGQAEAKLGTSVSIEGTTAIVGAPDEGGMGAAYVFAKQGSTWVEQATLVAPVRTDGGKFGYDVAIYGDTIVVGAPNADQTPLPDAGAAYVFVRTPGGWALQAKLSASDGKPDDAFGFGVGIWRDTVVVGANSGVNAPGLESGAAYVFTRIGHTWSQQAKLTPSDGAPHDNFGYSVGLSDDTAVAGVPSDDVGAAVDQGSVRVFKRIGSDWAEHATLTASDGLPGDQFGEATSISGDLAVAGAYFTTIGANPAQGAAYVFAGGGQGWKQEAKLTAPDGTARDMFGRSVAATGGHVAVGAHFEDGGGAVYVFGRRGSIWGPPVKLGSAEAGLFGVSTWMSGNTVISGANFTAVDGKAAQGAAYVADLRQ